MRNSMAKWGALNFFNFPSLFKGEAGGEKATAVKDSFNIKEEQRL